MTTQTTLAQECEAAYTGLAIADLSRYGKVRMTGKDGPDLLNRLTSNETLKLASGHFTTTVLTSNKGRIVEHLTVYTTAENKLSLLCGPGNAQKVIDYIDKFVFGEDVQMTDASSDLALFHVLGKDASRAITKLTNNPALFTERLLLAVDIGGAHVFVSQAPEIAGAASAFVMCNAADTAQVQRAIDGAPISAEAYEVLRVEAGVPMHDKELNEEHNPWEARLNKSIDLHKGCYVGQEVIARLNTYEKVARLMVGLEFTSGALPTADTKLYADGNEIGNVTSAVFSPRLNKNIGLGYVRMKWTAAGAKLEVGTHGSGETATVADLPF
ncbi:MAG: hypothetical protein EXR59_05410 [Dehalococcoidia bacterium]|nr:hypothetical protein [Dehalococcoidia bacterium]